MQCEQFELRWQQLMDERHSWESDPHLVAHSLNCDQCASRAAMGEQLLLGLEMDNAPLLPEGFAQRVVVAAGVGETETPPNRWGAIMTCVGLIAASLLLVFSLVPAPAPPTQARMETPPIPFAEPDSKVPPGVQDIVNGIAERFPRDEAARLIQHLDNNVARPITNSFGTAITAIYRTIPVPAPREKSAELTPVTPMTPATLTLGWA